MTLATDERAPPLGRVLYHMSCLPWSKTVNPLSRTHSGAAAEVWAKAVAAEPRSKIAVGFILTTLNAPVERPRLRFFDEQHVIFMA